MNMVLITETLATVEVSLTKRVKEIHWIDLSQIAITWASAKDIKYHSCDSSFIIIYMLLPLFLPTLGARYARKENIIK